MCARDGYNAGFDQGSFSQCLFSLTYIQKL